MPDKKISQLTELTQTEATDILAIVDFTGVNETKKISISNFMGSPGPIGSNIPNSAEFTQIELATGPSVDEISIDPNLGSNDDVLPTQNAVKTYVDNQVAGISSAIVNPILVSNDSTAIVGDVLLVDTTNGNVNIELIETPKGRIIVKKISSDLNKVIITSRNGFIYADAQESQVELNTAGESFTFITDTNNFYIV